MAFAPPSVDHLTRPRSHRGEGAAILRVRKSCARFVPLAHAPLIERSARLLGAAGGSLERLVVVGERRRIGGPVAARRLEEVGLHGERSLDRLVKTAGAAPAWPRSRSGIPSGPGRRRGKARSWCSAIVTTGALRGERARLAGNVRELKNSVARLTSSAPISRSRCASATTTSPTPKSGPVCRASR